MSIAKLFLNLTNLGINNTTEAVIAKTNEIIDAVNQGGGDYVDLTTNQTVGGIKTFTSAVVVNKSHEFLKNVASISDNEPAQYQAWYRINGTTRRGYFGFPSTGNTAMKIANEAGGGDILINGYVYLNGDGVFISGSDGLVVQNGSVTVGGDVDVPSGNVNLTSGDVNVYNGNIGCVSTGAAPISGTHQLNGTIAVTIYTTAVTANSIILLTRQNHTGGTIGHIYISGRATGSFDVKSTSASDNADNFSWLIINPI